MMGARSPQIMGVLNVTTDSFYAGSRSIDPPGVVERALAMVESGAALLDIGAQATNPQAAQGTPEEEWERLYPVLSALRQAVNVPLSVDTYHPWVMEKAVDVGVDILNDVNSKASVEVARLLKSYPHVKYVLMAHGAISGDPVLSIQTQWLDWLKWYENQGIKGQLILDPGIGAGALFGKTPEQDRYILSNLVALKKKGYPLLVGLSRKSFIGHYLGLTVEERLIPSVVGALWAFSQGADIVRVHDVAETKAAWDMHQLLVG